MDDRLEIESKLFIKYLKTGKIGNVTPYNREHAQKIAYAAALSIYNRHYGPRQQAIKPEIKQLALF